MSLWSLFGFVTQRSLLSSRLEFEDRPVDRASLFPLFDEQGQTRMLMIAAEENGRIMLADWSPGVFRRDWAWRNRLHLRFADLDDAWASDEERFEDLWHFDPVWVLGDDRYQGHGSVPALRSTNIPGYDAKVSDVTFDSTLGRASHLVTKSGDSVHVRRFSPDTLGEIARRRRAVHERPRVAATATGWRLRPFWHSLAQP